MQRFKRTIIRRIGAGAAMLCTLVLPAVGSSAGGSQLNGAAPKYAELPKVTFSKAPTEKDMPKSIPAASKMDGVFIALPKPNRYRYGLPGSRYVGMFVNQDDAKAFSKDKLQRWGRRPEDPSHPEAQTACFNIVDHWVIKQKRGEWPGRLQQWPQVQGATKGSQAAKRRDDLEKPRAFRLERLQIDGDHAKLHLLEGWLDVQTLGAKKTSAYAVTYDRVATGPGGVEVFAARAADGKRVEFIVHQPELETKRMSAVGRHMNVLRANMHGSSDCGHARVALRTAPGTGEHGAIRFDVVLPEDEKAKKERKAKEKQARRKPKLTDALGLGAPKPVEEIRIRTLVVHFGVSQGLEDKEPTVTVSFGWRGKERRQQIF